MAGLITGLALLAAPAHAQLQQDGEEEVLWDPEAEATAAAPSPLESSRTELRVVLHSRFGVDTYWEDDLEDVVEATQIALFEVTHHRTENLRFAVGLRGRHVAARRRGDDGDARYQLDAVPTAGYVDGTLVPGMYLRAGYQVVTLGRFDVFSAANVLAVQDLRSGPTAVPDALHVAQPALRLDVDRGSGFAFQAVYVPFFQPHLVTLYGTDYALLAPIDRELGPAPEGVPRVNRSALERASTGTFSAFAPEPDLEEPQGAMRATYRAGAGEVSLTTATALEKLPVLVIDPARTERPVSIDYPRFAVVSVDGAADAGPFQLGLEVAYMHDRSLFTEAVDDGPVGPSLGLGPVSISDVGPLDFALSEQTRVAHVAARAELVEGAEWIALVEAFFSYALAVPERPGRRWVGLEEGRFLRGAAGFVRWSPEKAPLLFELGGLGVTGPTFGVAPRAELKLSEAFALELGAIIVEGNSVPVLAPNASIGRLFDNIDQVFVGARWLP